MSERPDIYPMPSFPTFVVSDLAASVAWYRSVLGFQEVFSMGPTLSHLRWIKFADLLLMPGRPSPGDGVTISFQTPLEGIDALADRVRQAGSGKLLSEPQNRPWNVRDFVAADPDGYRLCFTGGPVDAKATMADISARFPQSSRT
jgi:catechol 2,3-dioxygenase-like lactoylglutathione lyase family enzyme